MEDGSDYEGYYPAIWWRQLGDGNKYVVGSKMPDIKFCPWCGVEVNNA